MRRTVLVLLLLIVGPVSQAEPIVPQPLAATPGEVFAAGLAFMEPRILDPVSIPDLSLWGLHGLTAMDASLVIDRSDGHIRLLSAGKSILTVDEPAANDANGWGVLAGQAVRAAAGVSQTVREAGRTAIIRSFFDEVFSHLDPYSRYVPPDDADDDRTRRTGTAGVGVQLLARHGNIFLRTVLADSPAADADLRPGDQIVRVDGRIVRGQSLASVNGLIAGPDGSPVTLTIHGQDGATGEVELIRATLPPETVFAERQGSILLLRISSFSRDTDDRLANELTRAFSTGGRVTGLIIDLRGNRGGLLRQAAEAVSRLMDHGIIATTAGRDPQSIHTFRAEGQSFSGERPIVVIVDGRSASAAEIMAAALSDNGQAVVIGSSTLGKGLVQTIGAMPDGGELFVTWSRVLAPLGWPIQGLGVLPQICTSLGDANTQKQLDSSLRGIPPMADAVARERATRAPVSAPQMLDIRSPCPASEGRETDLAAARFLFEHPAAYHAALISPMQIETSGAP